MKSEYTPHSDRLKAVDAYIRELFRDELSDSLKYHNTDHTLHPTKGVVAVANELAVLEQISEQDRELVITAAYFHDSGFIREHVKNEPIAARMAGRILKLIGYNPEEIQKIQAMILATDLAVEPNTKLEQIICDADLDNLGREDFFQLDEKLRQGEHSKGMEANDDFVWYTRTLDFMRRHRYYTDSQKKRREEGKQKNLKNLLKKLKGFEKPS